MSNPSVKKNLLYNTFYQILTMLTPFITAPYVSRVLGADGIGIQSYTSSVQSYFLLFAALGTASYGAREISRSRDNKRECSKLFWEIEFLTFGTAGLSLLAWLTLCLFGGKYRLFYFAMVPNILTSMLDISWFYSGLELFKLTVTRNTFFKILGIMLLFVLVKSPDDLLLYILVSSVTGVASSISLWLYLPKYVAKPEWKKLKIMPHFRQTLIYFVPTIATSIYTVLDKTLIGLITDDASQNGYYEQAEKIINMAKSVSFTAINSVVGVRTSYLFSERKFDEVHRRIENSINYILFMGFGCMFGIIGISRNFVPVFFGKGYDAVIPLLYILSPIIVIIGISNCLGSLYYTPIGKRVQSTKYLIAGALVNLALNSIFIPFWGAVGAAVASVAAESVITVLYMKNCDGYLTIYSLAKASWKKLLAGILMAAGVVLLSRIDANVYFVLGCQIIFGICFYSSILLIFHDEWFIGVLLAELRKLKKRFLCRKKQRNN